MELRERMILIADKHIPAGSEIRVDYEAGGEGDYWKGQAPAETNWSGLYKPPPPPGYSPSFDFVMGDGPKAFTPPY